MINFKKSLSLIISCILMSLANAQIPFVPQSFSSNSIKFEKAFDFCELPSGSFLFTGEKTNPDSTGFVFITDSKGNVLRSKYLLPKTDTTDIVFSNCFYRNDQKISLIGQNYDWHLATVGRTALCFSIIDSNLNVIHYKANKITNADTQLTGVAGFVSIQGNYYGGHGFIHSPGFDIPYVKLVRLNDSGYITAHQILDTNFYGNTYMETLGISPFSQSYDNKHLYYSSTSSGYLVKVDTGFRLIDSIAYNPNFFTQYTKDTGFNLRAAVNIEVSPNKLLIGSEFAFSYTANKVWGGLRYNFKDKIIEKFGVFPYFTDTYNAGQKNTAAFSNTAKSGNSVYTLGYTSGTLFHNNLVVCAFDTNVNTKWIKRIGDSVHQFRPIRIKVCRDGSIMICAYSDSATTPFDYAARDESIYVIRLDSATGNPLSIRNISEQLHSGITLYPNPAKEMINIKGASIGSQVLFYDMSGKIILNEKITANIMALDVEYLPAANYSYQVINPDGQKLSSGIWVKQ